MDRFVEVSLSFPVAIFGFMLFIAFLYWVVAMFGLFDMDSPAVEADGLLEGLGGLLMKAGLDGVPLPIVFTLVSLWGWLSTYIAELYVLCHIRGGAVSLLLGVTSFVAAGALAIVITNMLIRPLRRVFKKIVAPTAGSIIGRIATVRSGTVTGNTGEAIFEDGGAGLILNVRSMNGATFSRGDNVALLEYQPANHCYLVISEYEFNR
ncbi:hypothetical protein [Pseudomonas typographi]|uniref:Uncharacterized protein n=1 Tax=Pseudomonas typographi TaxID=2715964 RepID=A0ABR7YVN9_9PSED|nr:hypothetical protein [Pseudomonas typographi]MBD1554910.1 hypothetical protein [Pseudomonas typographi]MBD1597235.1 hypothetical protein [Pseudomonas typographi]